MLVRPGARAGKGRLGLGAGHLEGWVGEDMGKRGLGSKLDAGKGAGTECWGVVGSSELSGRTGVGCWESRVLGWGRWLGRWKGHSGEGLRR